MTVWLLLLAQGGWSEVDVPPKPAAFERLAEAGERLYGWHCLPCHGPEGKGDGPNATRLGLKPRDLTRGLFKLKTSPAGQGPFDEDLFRTITAGLPVRFMPAFREPLEPDDRWAIIAFLRTLSAERAKDRFDVPAEKGDAARGATLFQGACAACHGREGKGNGPAAMGLIPDLGRGEIEFLGGARSQDVYRALTTGMESSAMPSFASLPVKDRLDLAAFVPTLYRAVAEGERHFFRKGCVACHTIGKGKHLGPDLAGVGARRSEDWLRRWLSNPELMAVTDPDAKRLLAEYRIVMPDPKLSQDELRSLARWLGELR